MCVALWKRRDDVTKADEMYKKYIVDWCKAGEIIQRLGLTVEDYLNAFMRDVSQIVSGVNVRTLASEKIATRACASLLDLQKIERDSTMDPKKAVQADLDWAMTKIFDQTGRLVVDEDAMPALRTTLYAIEDYMKLCLAPRDPVVLEMFGKSGCQQLEDSPGTEEAIHTGNFGFDLQALMDIRAYFWSVTKKNPKRTWYPSR